MADYNGRQFSLVKSEGTFLFSMSSGNLLVTSVWEGLFASSLPGRPHNGGEDHFVPRKMILNRGRNTGGGDAYAYWQSPDTVDTDGLFYTGSIPFVQLTDIMQVGVMYPAIYPR